jgi:hypothetical protein
LGYSICSKDNLKYAIQMGINAFEELCEREKRFTQELKLIFGDDIYTRVSKICGVKTRIWDVEFRDGVAWLLELLEGDHTKLPTIMCDGLASRLHKPEFRDGIAWLLSVGFSQKKIVTLLGDDGCVTKFDTKFSELINVGPTISRKRAREL